jgi:hypothetical protein
LTEIVEVLARLTLNRISLTDRITAKVAAVESVSALLILVAALALSVARRAGSRCEVINAREAEVALSAEPHDLIILETSVAEREIREALHVELIRRGLISEVAHDHSVVTGLKHYRE